jgi:hypothetical protein
MRRQAKPGIFPFRPSCGVDAMTRENARGLRWAALLFDPATA